MVMRARRTTISRSVWAAALLCAPAAFAGTVIEPELRLTAEERYDDDSLLRTENSLNLGGELMTKVTPEVGVSLKNRTLDAKAWYAPDFQLRHLSGTFRMDHRGGLMLDKRLSRRHGVFANLGIWRVADPTSLPRMGVGRTLAPVLYGTADVGLRAQLAERWQSTFRYRFEGTRVFEQGWPSGQVHAPTAELWYQLTPRLTAGPEYRFQYFIYGPEHAVAHSPVMALRYRLSPVMSLAMRAGPVWFSEVGGQGAGVAPRVHAEISRRGRRFEVGLQLGQDVIGASGFSSALWAQYGGLYTSWQLSAPLRLFGAGYAFRNGAAPGQVGDYLGQTNAGQNGYAVSAGVEWRLNQQFTVQGQVDRIAQVGVFGPDADLARNIASVRLVVTPFE